MPSPQTLQNKSGFLVLEALVAMGVLLMIIPAALLLGFSSQALQISIQNRLDGLSGAADIISNGAYEQAASSSGRYFHEFGGSTCTVGSSTSQLSEMPDFSGTKIYVNDPSAGIDFGANASGTDVTARNGFIYETVDSPTQSAPDFYIIDATTPQSPTLVSSLNTGPGLAAVAVAGHYAYVANESSLSELQVLDIEDRTKPVIAAKFKLPIPPPLPATTTAPHASGISYGNGLIFLGTEKWAGDEFNIINVSQPTIPQYAGGFDAESVVHSIYVDTYAPNYAYVADADAYQMRVLDISDPSHATLLSGFSPPGYGVLEGETFSDAGTVLYFARAGGGFDNPSQYELFSFDLGHDPLATNPTHVLNVPGGVYGIVTIPGYVFLAVGDDTVQVWKDDLSSMLYSMTLPARPVSLICDHNRLYVGLAGRQGFAIIIPSII